jgi:hypothetical protein
MPLERVLETVGSDSYWARVLLSIKRRVAALCASLLTGLRPWTGTVRPARAERSRRVNSLTCLSTPGVVSFRSVRRVQTAKTVALGASRPDRPMLLL